jgi:DnaJ-class molecular chaperone
MGKSITVACIGHAQIGKNKMRIFDAMNRLEIQQAQMKAKKEGLEITEWYAQTKAGAKTLGVQNTFVCVSHSKVPAAKTVVCPVCNGKGGKQSEPGVKHSCVVCNGSGITAPGFWNKWNDWQIEEFKAEFADA